MTKSGTASKKLTPKRVAISSVLACALMAVLLLAISSLISRELLPLSSGRIITRVRNERGKGHCCADKCRSDNGVYFYCRCDSGAGEYKRLSNTLSTFVCCAWKYYRLYFHSAKDKKEKKVNTKGNQARSLHKQKLITNILRLYVGVHAIWSVAVLKIHVFGAA